MSTPDFFAPETEQALRAAREMASNAGHNMVLPLHLAAVLVQDQQGILRQAIAQVSGGDNRAADSFDKVLSTNLANKTHQEEKKKKKRTHSSTKSGSGDSEKCPRSPSLCKVIKRAETAQQFGAGLELGQLVLSLHSDQQISNCYRNARVHMEQVLEELRKHVGGDGANSTALEMYGHDLVAEARAGKLNDAAISRFNEIHSVANILSSINKNNNAILIGEPGVGKTAIVQGLALHIAERRSSSLKGARLIALNMGRLVDDDECEKRLREVLKEVKEAQGKVILFIKDIHSVPGVGTTDGSINAPNLMKPLLLDLGNVRHLQCIGSTTPENYHKYIDKDSAFNRHFEKVQVRELSVEDTITILRVRKENFEFDYGVSIDDDALETAARLASRYITAGRRLPDKAIAVVDKACTRVSRQLESWPMEMDILEDDKTKLKAELRSLGKDKAKKARRDEIKKQLLDLREELMRQTTEYEEKKERIRKYMEWCQDEESAQLKDAYRRKLSPSMLKNFNPVETLIALVPRELRGINKQKKFLSFLERKLKEKVNENEEGSKAKWEKRQVTLANMRGTMHKSMQEWKDFNKECESAKCFEDVMRDRTVDREKIEQEVSREAKIPVSRLGREEKKRLRELAAALQRRVVGQEEAVKAVVNAIIASKRRDKQQQKPIGSFLFLGPTGVGKTELAKALAEQLFHDEKQFIRFDMSEYGEEHSVSGLIGAPPGYEGHDVGGSLTDAVWSKPYSVVLFDEIDKANKVVLNILLQVLDDGILTDRKGKKVDFTNTVIIMTSNLIAKKDHHDGQNSMNEEENIHRKSVNEHLSPELRGRITNTVNFNRLSDEHLRNIARHHIKVQEGCFNDLGLTLDVTDDAVNFILNQPEVKTYGARKLRTWIETEMMGELTSMEIDNKIVKNCTVHIDAVAGKKELAYNVKKSENSNMNEDVSEEDSTDDNYYGTSDDEPSNTDEEGDIFDSSCGQHQEDTRKNKRKREDDQPQEYTYTAAMDQPVHGGVAETEGSEQAEDRPEAREAGEEKVSPWKKAAV